MKSFCHRLISFLIAIFLIAPAILFAQDESEIEENLAKDSSTEINVRNADLVAVVRIFSKKTKRNYILDEKVSGKVSIYLPGKISSDESIKILDSVLDLKGFTSVPIGENLWKIVPAKDAKQSTIPTIIGDDGEYTKSSSMITRLYTLKFVTADDMKQLLSPLVSSNGLVNAYTGTNSLIIIDSEDNIERLLRIVRELDVPFSDREMTIIPILHADAPDIAEKLKELLLDSSSDSSNGNGSVSSLRARISDQVSKSNANAVAGLSGTTGSTISARLREPKIIADERTNSVIVVADEETTARIRALISQLDSEVNRAGQRFYVYRCQHASAEELAEVLSGLVSGGVTTPSSSSSSSQQSTGDRAAERSSNRLSRQQRTPGQSRNTGDRSSGVSTVSLGEEVSITADPATNSLVINSNKSDYEKIRSLLDQLDVKRRQVLVEAMLLEVGITDSRDLGTEFITSTGGADGGIIAQSNFGNLGSLISDPTQIANFSIAAASSGSLTLPGDITIPSQTVLLTAAQQNSNVNVLSAPNILATDNEQAEIVVGQNVPFLASTSSSQDNLNNTFNQIDRQDVGITLRLTPQINSNNYVTLALFTEVSNVVSNTAGSELGPTTTVRTSETTVITRDGQMVVIGGLISDNVQASESGVPFLKDIPIIGHAFKSHNDAITRTNLLIFITPRIVKDQFDARDITKNNRDKLQYEMVNNEIYPSRSEVLQNPEIDSVIEQPEFETSNTGPILPPYKNNSGETLRELEAGMPSNSKAPTQPKIELKVKPRLPNDSAAINSPDARAALKPSVISNSDSSAQGKFIILEASSKKTSSHLPLNRIKGSEKFGIIIPQGGATAANSFFQLGKGYKYKLEGVDVALKVVQVFNDANEVEKKFPGASSSWHTLSPYEVMNLGKYPWVKTN
ncbi:MAG: type II secretion system secretin GspD [Bdellovibrionales bacterium]|nr:type II secretion system secretin GspD [Bdellovibrionales bacterium]